MMEDIISTNKKLSDFGQVTMSDWMVHAYQILEFNNQLVIYSKAIKVTKKVFQKEACNNKFFTWKSEDFACYKNIPC